MKTSSAPCTPLAEHAKNSLSNSANLSLVPLKLANPETLR